MQRRVNDLEVQLLLAKDELLDLKVAHENFVTGVASRADAARQEEIAAEELDEHRRRCWYDHSLDQFMVPGRPPVNEDTELAEFCSKSKEQHMAEAPPEGWPPGYDPSMFAGVPATNRPPMV